MTPSAGSINRRSRSSRLRRRFSTISRAVRRPPELDRLLTHPVLTRIDMTLTVTHDNSPTPSGPRTAETFRPLPGPVLPFDPPDVPAVTISVPPDFRARPSATQTRESPVPAQARERVGRSPTRRRDRRDSGDGVELHGVAKLLQLRDQPARVRLVVALGKPLRS